MLASLLMCGVSSQALAQDAGSLLRDRERQGETPNLDPLPKEEAGNAVLPEASTESGETIRVTTLSFTGKATLLLELQQASLKAQVEGKDVGLKAIQALAENANTALRQNGFLLARAIIPPQDATSGTLQIEINEGEVETVAFEYAKPVRVRKELLEHIANREIDRSSLTKADLEEAMLRISDLPGVVARARLAPGERAGTTRIVADVTEEPVLSGSFHVDNHGSPSTGRWQGHAQLALTDLTGDGDQTRLGLSLSEGQRYASASVAVPLSASELLATFDYAYLFFENVDDVGKAAGLEGDAHYASMGLTYRAVRSREANLNLSAELNGKVLKDDSSAGRLADKRIYSGTMAISGDNRDELFGGGVTQYSLSWTYGDLDLSNLPVAKLIDALSFKTQGKFHRVNLDATRLQKLPGDFSLLTRISGQWASKNLDSSESFSLGGPYGVRGWPVGEGRGDMGFTGSVELRYDAPLPEKAGALQLSAFADSGRVKLNKNQFGIPPVNACGCNSYSLSSVGAGASWRLKNLSLSASWSHGFGDNPGRSAFGDANADGSTRRHQFWLTGSFRF
jgi:hemolysin activation/secretion protein